MRRILQRSNAHRARLSAIMVSVSTTLIAHRGAYVRHPAQLSLLKSQIPIALPS
jgi:hypothetical protein